MRLAAGGGEPRHHRRVEEVDQATRLVLLRVRVRLHPHRHLRRTQRRRCARRLQPKQLRSPTCYACSHFCSDLQLCRVCYYCIPVYDYVLLTIRVSRRPTAVDKRRFKVRLSVSTYCAR